MAGAPVISAAQRFEGDAGETLRRRPDHSRSVQRRIQGAFDNESNEPFIPGNLLSGSFACLGTHKC